uniref:Putative something about silencing protein 10 isoform X1 n=1 Tax=Davidia involucrata TaxID=16924 RepID=A0A5B7BUU4_DAVIN
MGTEYEEVKKDLNALSRDEKMDVVYSSAPELVGLLSELNDALEQLEKKVNPLLSKVREGENTVKGGMRYMEVKQLVLLAYCQAITFYLLLKSEGQPVRDHPVIARLVEIKNLLDKMRQLDGNLPSEIEDIFNKKHETETAVNLIRENDALVSDFVTTDHKLSLLSAKTQAAMPHETTELVKVDSSKDNENEGGERKRRNHQVGLQSIEMLKVRAALEEKLKQKGIFSSITPKCDRTQKHVQPVNGQLETYDDFDDDAMVIERGTRGMSNGHASLLHSSKLSQLVTPQLNKPKAVAGDDDLPKRDDIGERRRKHELRVLATAGINSVDDVEDEHDALEGIKGADMEEDGGMEESEDEFYKQVKKQRAAKLAAKAEIYSRTSTVPSLPDTLVDRKRHITSQMEKNRGLTRARKKLTKNPRKKYKLKHKKAVVRRKGQVREIKRPAGPYGGEASGINAGISRSVRFTN